MANAGDGFYQIDRTGWDITHFDSADGEQHDFGREAKLTEAKASAAKHWVAPARSHQRPSYEVLTAVLTFMARTLGRPRRWDRPSRFEAATARAVAIASRWAWWTNRRAPACAAGQDSRKTRSAPRFRRTRQVSEQVKASNRVERNSRRRGKIVV
jgi:hypothetical protein